MDFVKSAQPRLLHHANTSPVLTRCGFTIGSSVRDQVPSLVGNKLHQVNYSPQIVQPQVVGDGFLETGERPNREWAPPRRHSSSLDVRTDRVSPLAFLFLHSHQGPGGPGGPGGSGPEAARLIAAGGGEILAVGGERQGSDPSPVCVWNTQSLFGALGIPETNLAEVITSGQRPPSRRVGHTKYSAFMRQACHSSAIVQVPNDGPATTSQGVHGV